jgi:hypothetical protein
MIVIPDMLKWAIGAFLLMFLAGVIFTFITIRTPAGLIRKKGGGVDGNISRFPYRLSTYPYYE